MKYIYALLLALLLNISLAQHISISQISAISAAQDLTTSNSGITILNAGYTGDYNQFARFSNPISAFPLSSGIVVTNGNASFATSSNTGNDGDDSPSSTGANVIFNTDLANLVPGQNITQYGTIILEFDFKIEGQILSLNYGYASDEYNYCANNSYADPMGIFISGGNISGHVNIAKIGSANVNVNTINGCINNSLYINNCRTNTQQQCNGSCGAPSGDIREIPYNGFTKKLTATYTLPVCDPNTVYHLAISICNATDNNRDSGIFLESGSMKSELKIGDLVANPSPVCNGSTFNIMVQNVPFPNLNYNWSTGQSGTNLSSINTVASLGTPSYNVAISSGSCTINRSINVTVHDNNNVPPYTNGVNGTGNNVIYVQSGANSCENIPSFDYPNELVFISSSNYPSGSNFFPGNQQQAIGTFCWTPPFGQVGVYHFDVITTDNNVCGSLSGSQPFVVKVACPSCYLDVFYQNRQPGNNPLPAFTKAPRYIIAGSNVIPGQPTGNVETGNATVEFKATNIITNLGGFIAGPGYWAHIDPNTCITDCEDCCEHFNGITLEQPLPNVVTPNGDGVNDIWMVNDYANQLCAYGAQSFNLVIKAPDGRTVYTQSSNSNGACCPFRSAAPGGTTGIVSSIHWIPSSVVDGTYFYVLDISGCNTTQSFAGNITVIGSGNHRKGSSTETDTVPNNDSLAFYNHPVTASDRELSHSGYADAAGKRLSLFPNPAVDRTSCLLETFDTSNHESVTIDLYSSLGIQVRTFNIRLNRHTDLDLKGLTSGTYVVKTTYNFTTFNKTLIITN
jgi:hypothetical protein